ncbi:MAG TPA: hypothetical protein VK427_06735, partial [Kofleriaceae bacterium]|nr:hypothetical protein [Kofleriaceae bacterium]
MRSAIFLGLLLGCGNDVGLSPDATVPAAPRVIAGGGIGDGPITGVVNLHVIDDVTRRPIPNATVRVGTVTGATDASGLFVARGVTGPQTIVAKANSYRPDVWVGVDGANVTINLQAANPSPPTGTVTGTITSFDSLPVPAGHVRVAIASYSQLDTLGDEDNNLAQPNNQNICLGSTCSFTLTSRTGRVAVLAAIFDTDLHGTPFDLTDDTSTLLGWAVQTDVMVTANGTHTVTLGIVPATALQDVTVSFGSPPSGLAEVGALVGIDTPDGVLQLTPVFPTPAAPTLRAPKPQAT